MRVGDAVGKAPAGAGAPGAARPRAVVAAAVLAGALAVSAGGGQAAAQSVSEPSGGDLAFNSSTSGVVAPGSVATGVMDAVLDRTSRVNRGDFWRLDGTAGRRYRVEVIFDGDGERSAERGGGVQLVSGGTWSSSVWDTSRDDGYVIVEITAASGQHLAVHANNDYHNPDTGQEQNSHYYGDYSISMTDITGVSKTVGNAAFFCTADGEPPDAANACDPDYITVGDTSTSANTQYAVSIQTATTACDCSPERIEAYIGEPSAASNPLVSLHEDSNGAPGDKLFDFESPLALRRHIDRFHAPDDAAALTADTAYWVVFTETTATGTYQLDFLTTPQPDAQSTGAGWQIAEPSLTRNSAEASSTWEEIPDDATPQFDFYTTTDSAGGV